MKYLLFLALVLSLLSVPALASTELCSALTTNTSQPDLRALVANLIGSRLDMDSLRARLERYTGEAPLGDGSLLKERGSKEGREKARREIEAELKFFGYESTREEFEKGANIIASIKGSESADEILEITAHYDSVGNPGADDNGSGLALVMELARMMKLNPPKRTVRFVFMDLEEVGFQGSLHHAARLAEAKENLAGVLVLDTIAWANPETERQLVVLEAGTESMSRASIEYRARVKFAQNLLYPLTRIGREDGKLRISVETAAAAPRTADHGSYWRYGLPAILIGEAFEDGLITPFYHSYEDRTVNVNWDFYREVSRTVLEMVAYVAGAELIKHDDTAALEIALLLEREDMSFDGSLAWPPAPLARAPFLTAKQAKAAAKAKPDPDHAAATAALDRAFVLGDLGDTAGIVFSADHDGMWMIGLESFVMDLSHLSNSAKMEVAAEVAYFGGEIWQARGELDGDYLADLRDEALNASETPENVIVRRDLSSKFWEPSMYTGIEEVDRKTTPEKLRKVLNDKSRDAVLVLARRRRGGDEFLTGALVVRHFNSIQFTPLEEGLTWDELRSLKDSLAARLDGTPPVQIFTGADFEDEDWIDEVIPNLFRAEDRLKLQQNGFKFKSEF